MSCQQVSRFITTDNSINITNNNNHNAPTKSNCKKLINNQNHNIIKGNLITRGVIQQEDPYVFTESVPTTPPILFNTQKTRTRLSDLTSTSVGKLQQQKLPLTEANGKITDNLNFTKTQASFLSSTTTTTTNTCSLPTTKNNVNQSLTITTATITNNHSNSRKQANVCIVRPQLQTQQSHYHHQNFVNSSSIYEGDLKSISPPPLYTPPTPSLWQTPLLLETTAASINSKVTNAVALKTPTTTTSQNVPIMGCVTPTVQTVGCTTITMNSSLTTTAMAKVAPIIVHTPLVALPAQSPNQCLPPSKFHNHTLAQHIQKVECLKNSTKSTEAEKLNSITSSSKTSSASTLSKVTSLNVANNSANTDNHSENEDLNEIPVNVIFRMAVGPQANEKSSNNFQNGKPQTEIDTQPSQQPQQPQTFQTAPPSSPNTTQLKTNVKKKLSVPASKTTITKQLIKEQRQPQEQINTSSIPQQQHNATKLLALNSQQQNQMPNEADENTCKIPTTSEFSKKNISDPKIKTTTTTHISSKTRKPTSFPSTNLSFDLPYNWHMDCSTTKGAVAIVKMSQHNIDLDNNHLATVTGLPYCLQQNWLNSYDIIKSTSDVLLREKSLVNLSLAREERIAVYKQQLCRQAVQLLSTRSLQKLPFKNAKRRLMCVDRLLRKYQQSEQNKQEKPANIKRCCVTGCDVYTLDMASHCQRHIVNNAAQHVFLPCTAKFADNTQCRVPVFDITHDLPLCMEHARKRDAYNRLLYEQRPRKISTNPHLINESVTFTPKLSPTDKTIAELLPSGISTKKQNNQNKPKQQHLLQQFATNTNSNSNKRPALVNQQARKRKMTVGLTTNPVGRPQKRLKKTIEKSIDSLTATTITKQQMPRLTSTCLKRKSSTTSLESIASNSQHSTTSNTSQHQQQSLQQYQRQKPPPHQHMYGVMSTISNSPTTSLAPPALAPLSGGLVGHGLPQHLFSFGHDNIHSKNTSNKTKYLEHQLQQPLHPINLNEKHSFSVSTTSITTASTPTELKDFISQFSFNSQNQIPPAETSTADVNLLNTNSNSNFTSSGMGSTTSLPTADDFITQDMLSICENSSASSADTGLGGLSDHELMLGGPDDDIPLGDAHLLEEHDLENVLNSLPEDAFKELFTTVHQDESDEIERAIELADKHLKTLQQTIGSGLGDFLDDMLMDNGDLCNESSANTTLDTSALFIGGGTVGSTSLAVAATNRTQGGGADVRGLVQT